MESITLKSAPKAHSSGSLRILPHSTFGAKCRARHFFPCLLGSAQIDVKISFKGRQPNKESAQSRSAATFPRPRLLHTKRNLILDAWRSLKGLNFALPIRKKEIKSAFLRSRKRALAAD